MMKSSEEQQQQQQQHDDDWLGKWNEKNTEGQSGNNSATKYNAQNQKQIKLTIN